MRKFGTLHRGYFKVQGETIGNPISDLQDLISEPSHINDFCFDQDDFFGRFKYFSMLDYKYASYTEIINQNFRPLKKKR